MREKTIEHKLKKEIEKLGGICLKFHSPYHRGMPDRIIILPQGVVYFVELKAEGGKTSELQRLAEKKLKRLSQNYALVEGEKGLQTFLTHINMAVNI